MSALLSLLSLHTGLAEVDLLRIIRTAPRRYKVYEIPKRSGGTRTIAQPARELKFIQRVLVEQILSKLPIHEAATAYRPGYSIQKNAARHAGSGPILKMDFEEFFPSIKGDDWRLYCRNTGILDEDDIESSALILFRRAKGDHLLKLAIGAPSSPILSNILMSSFDAIVAAEADRRRIAYTRYADDLTFSGQRIGMLKDMVRVVHEATRQLTHPKLRVNNSKTHFITARNRRVVTGVVLTNDRSLSLGRDRKRLLVAQVHYAINQKLNEEEIKRLVGMLAFANVIEPSFIRRLQEKYGYDAIKQIKSQVKF